MELASLLPRPGEVAEQPLTYRTLMVCCGGQAAGTGVLARRGLAEERLLTAVREHIESIELMETVLGKPVLAPDNPHLSAEALHRLDDSGIIPEGSVVKSREVLVSVVEARAPRKDQPEAASPQEMRDGSWHVPEGWDGARVVSVQRQTQQELRKASRKGLLEHIQITLRAEDDLAVGDVLTADGTLLGVVGQLVADGEMPRAGDWPVDLVLPAAVGARLGLGEGERRSLAVGRAKESGADALQARSMGAYSLISLQPLGNGPEPGQAVGPEHVHWLCSRGLMASVAELTSLKCDDLTNRERLRALLTRPEPAKPGAVPAPGAPESLFTLQTWLSGLGLKVEITSHSGHVDLAVRPALTEEIIACSVGPIRKPETIDYRTYQDIEDGIFCPKVFGPSGGRRRRRWGHVTLPVPVVPLLWRMGTPSLLERLLDLPAKAIERLVHYEEALDEEGGPVRGGAAIRALLRRVPRDRLPPGLRGRADALVPEAVPVVPPDFRPLVLLDSGNFATADVNDLYRRLLNRRNRLEKLAQLNAPAPILENEGLFLQGAADAVWANILLPIKQAVVGEQNRRLRDCLDMVIGSLLESFKRVDWSARARVVAETSLSAGRAQIPRRILETLPLPADHPLLVTAASEGEGAFVAVAAEAHEDRVVRLAPDDFAFLGLDRARAPECVLHRPLGRKAIEEAKLLQKSGDPGPVETISDRTGWVDGETAEEIVTGLIEAALDGGPVCLTSPRGRLIGGAGAVAALAADVDPTPEDHER
jgi:hypothetical protein